MDREIGSAVPRRTGSFKFLFLHCGLALALAQAPLANSQPAFSIKVVTSSGDQFWVNSIIIEGAHEVMLVDAQLTKTNAERVLQEIKATNKPLSIVYITHEHADHFLGLEVFREAYPAARILANSNVVDRINKGYQEKIDKWKGILGPGATSHAVAISKYDERLSNLKIREWRSSGISRAIPMKTPCFGFPGRKHSSPATCSSMTCTFTRQRRMCRRE